MVTLIEQLQLDRLTQIEKELTGLFTLKEINVSKRNKILNLLSIKLSINEAYY